MAPTADIPHLPTAAPIDAYGNGGFRFGGMSHRGSLLCLPDGIWAWPVNDISELNERTLTEVFARAGQLDIFLIGCGRDPCVIADRLRVKFRNRQIAVDATTTGPAVRTYNILLAEGRRVGAGLIAVA